MATVEQKARLEFSLDANPEKIQLENKVYVDNKLYRRFIQTYEFEIVVGGFILRNETVDISLGGLCLKHPVPDGAGVRFDATLIRSNGEKVRLMCCLVDGSSARKRIRFDLDETEETVLPTWILSASEQEAR